MQQRPPHLDDDQWQAVSADDGPVLVLAGAGSGKTRVLTERIVYLIEQKGYSPHKICALTFTNKAAREMHRRIVSALQTSGRMIHPHNLAITTFHSLALRLIKSFTAELGYKPNLSIYDDSDQVHLIKDICQEKGWDLDRINPKGIVSYFARIKEQEFAHWDPERIQYFDIFQAYQAKLKEHNAVDFADMLICWYRLLTQPETKARVAKQWDYLLVDEFQDTNTIQFEILKLMCDHHKNLFAVGDEDQSIYKFRGAVIANILNFDDIFPGVQVIPLRSNYRSTHKIVKAAEHVINNNQSRKGHKDMNTHCEEGEPVTILQFESDQAEARYVVQSMSQHVAKGGSLSDIAVFYRTHSLSRIFEDALRKSAIPYRVFGSIRFYDRAEIKNALAYFKVVVNPNDAVALKRIINTPPRGIGKTSIQRIIAYAEMHAMPLYEVMSHRLDQVQLSAKARKGIQGFVSMMQKHRAMKDAPISEVVNSLIDASDYLNYLAASPSPDAQMRVDNLQELKNAIAEYEAMDSQGTLDTFLESLHLDHDLLSEAEEHQPMDYVSLMTCHAAKGLEYPKVFVVGCEEGCFPLVHASSYSSDPDDLEEERRLFYVAMTRAQKDLSLSYALRRKVYGLDQPQRPSRFIYEVPEDYARWVDLAGSPFGTPNTYRAEEPKVQRSTSKNVGLTYEYEPEATQDECGKWIQHPVFGKGQVIAVEDSGGGKRFKISFNRYGVKRIAASFVQDMMG